MFSYLKKKYHLVKGSLVHCTLILPTNVLLLLFSVWVRIGDNLSQNMTSLDIVDMNCTA